MVVQSKKAQVFLLFFSLAFTLALGITGYLFLKGRPDLSADESKYNAEILLYLSLLFCLLIAGMYVYIFVRNRNILKELDKIIEMSTYNNFSPVQSLERLSTIGEKIGQLYKNVSMVSEKRALKISSLNSLSNFLLDNVFLLLIITDVRGVVTSVSKQFRDKYPDQTNLVSTSIINFLPDLKMQVIMNQFDENYALVETKLGKVEITIYPIRNREFEISNFVFVIGKGNLVQDETVTNIRGARAKEPAKRGLFSKLLNRRYKK